MKKAHVATAAAIAATLIVGGAKVAEYKPAQPVAPAPPVVRPVIVAPEPTPAPTVKTPAKATTVPTTTPNVKAGNTVTNDAGGR